jgi:hypothetical protein
MVTPIPTAVRNILICSDDTRNMEIINVDQRKNNVPIFVFLAGAKVIRLLKSISVIT